MRFWLPRSEANVSVCLHPPPPHLVTVATVAILVHYGLLVKGLRPKDVNYVMCGVWLREVYQEQDQNADVG